VLHDTRKHVEEHQMRVASAGQSLVAKADHS
jgi:hypothetical protein